MGKKLKRKVLPVVILLTIIIFLVAGIFIIFNFQNIKDSIDASAFELSSEIAVIEKNLNLTEKGKTIFRASKPTIDSKNAMRSNCKADDNLVVLGCYENRQIHINKDESTAAEGLAETTAAHELLHAIWLRLSDTEIEELTPELKSVYASAKTDFTKTLAPYPAEEIMEEIYVRSAIQLEVLPVSLENHYAKYFNSRKTVYNFYQESKSYEQKTGRLIY